jgi:hypothetical protein
MGNFRDDQFTTCELTASVWEPGGSRKKPVVTRNVEVSIRAWLPLHTNVPLPTFPFTTFSETAVREFEERITSMWFPNLPGISPWDIAENYAEYLALRAIEEWAKSSKLLPV